MSVMSGLKSTALHQWEYRMQGYTNGVSIFQRDFAVKQDYPEIIKSQIIKVLSKKQRYGWLPRQRDRGAWKQRH